VETRLTVELVPSTCWYTNALGGLGPPSTPRCPNRWLGGRGRPWPVECHEAWD